MTLTEIKAWAANEANNPEPSVLFVKVCDELALIKALEQNLHNHSITDQVEEIVMQATWEHAPEPVKKAVLLIMNQKEDKAMEYFYNRVHPDTKEHNRKRVIEVIKTSKDPNVKKAYDWESGKFLCPVDQEVMNHINNSIEYINGLFLKLKT